MTDRQILENYRAIVVEILALENHSAFLDKFYIGGPQPVRAVRLTGMPRGTNDPEMAIMQRADYENAITMIENKVKDLQGLLLQFENIIDSVQDKEDAAILRLYYALAWTDKQIGDKLGYDKTTIWKKRTKAIEMIG